MKERKTDYRVGIGSSSVLMILVVLTMTALGLLALGSARQTEKQTRRNLEASLGYYEAAARVQRALADIDDAIAEYGETGATEQQYAERTPESVEWSQDNGTLAFTITEDAGDGRTLVAEGETGAEGDGRYVLKSHTLISSYVEDTQDLRLIGE